MIFPVDIHTHRLPQVLGEAIVNCYPETFAPEEGGWYSVGIHPWHSTFFHSENDYSTVLADLIHHPQVLAVGEAGLDKLTDAPLSVQLEVFECQARLAMEVDKPLVIHLVKAVDELLKLKQQLKPTNPWIIHGFRGKATLAEVYLRHGFYLSLGEKYQADVLRAIPSDRLLLETDESIVSIHTLYERAAAIRGISLEDLCQTVRQNIGNIFFKR